MSDNFKKVHVAGEETSEEEYGEEGQHRSESEIKRQLVEGLLNHKSEIDTKVKLKKKKEEDDKFGDKVYCGCCNTRATFILIGLLDVSVAGFLIFLMF